MDDGKRSSLNVTFVRGFPRGKTQLTPSGYPKPVGSAGFIGAREVDFCTTSSNELNVEGFFWFDVMVSHIEAILRPEPPPGRAKDGRDNADVRSATPQNG